MFQKHKPLPKYKHFWCVDNPHVQICQSAAGQITVIALKNFSLGSVSIDVKGMSVDFAVLRYSSDRLQMFSSQ